MRTQVLPRRAVGRVVSIATASRSRCDGSQKRAFASPLSLEGYDADAAGRSPDSSLHPLPAFPSLKAQWHDGHCRRLQWRGRSLGGRNIKIMHLPQIPRARWLYNRLRFYSVVSATLTLSAGSVNRQNQRHRRCAISCAFGCVSGLSDDQGRRTKPVAPPFRLRRTTRAVLSKLAVPPTPSASVPIGAYKVPFKSCGAAES